MKAPRAISNSQLTAFKKSPSHWLQYVTETRKRTDAMLLGSVCHCLTLEKQNFDKQYFVMDRANMPEPNRMITTNANKAWKENQIKEAGQKEIIDSAILDQAQNIIEALYTNDVAVQYIKAGKEFESKLSWKCLGLEFYGIRDITSDEFIADLKFVKNADPIAFQRDLFKNGYYRQGGMYMDGEMKGQFYGDPHKRVLFIAVETSPPFGVSVHELTPEVISFGVNEYRTLAEQLKMCLDSEVFPSYEYRSINDSFDVYLPAYMQLNDL